MVANGRVKKYEVLLKSRAADEHKAAKELKDIRDVVERRRAAFDVVEQERKAAKRQLRSLRSEKRPQALLTGHGGRVLSLEMYGKRLRDRFNRLEKKCQERKKELDQAIEREEYANQDLVEARVEKKKIEHLIGNEKYSRTIVDAARDEAELDELSGSFKREK